MYTPKNEYLGSILDYGFELKKRGRAEATVLTAVRHLKRLSKLCDLHDSEQVRTVLATLKWQNSTKHLSAHIYTRYLKWLGKTWEQPTYSKANSLPFIPLEKELDALMLFRKRK